MKVLAGALGALSVAAALSGPAIAGTRSEQHETFNQIHSDVLELQLEYDKDTGHGLVGEISKLRGMSSDEYFCFNKGAVYFDLVEAQIDKLSVAIDIMTILDTPHSGAPQSNLANKIANQQIDAAKLAVDGAIKNLPELRSYCSNNALFISYTEKYRNIFNRAKPSLDWWGEYFSKNSNP